MRKGLIVSTNLNMSTGEWENRLSGSEAATGFGRGDEDYGATITKLHKRIDNRKKQIAEDRDRIGRLERNLEYQSSINRDLQAQIRGVQARCYRLERANRR